LIFALDASVVKKYVKDKVTPLFDWGTYYKKEGQLIISISVQKHHSFIDILEKYRVSF